MEILMSLGHNRKTLLAFKDLIPVFAGMERLIEARTNAS
jgi:hypothetical protein